MSDNQAVIDLVISKVKSKQEDSEVKANAGRDISERLSQRERFHELLGDDSVETDVINKFLASSEYATFALELSEEDIETTRRVISKHNLIFSPYEPADIVYYLSIAIDLIIQNMEGDGVGFGDKRIIFATHSQYSPHGDISLLAPNVYLVLMGRYLLLDLLSIAYTMGDLVKNCRLEGQSGPFIKHLGSQCYLDMFFRTAHRMQLPYLVSSIAFGEKYRFGTDFSFEDEELKESDDFYLLMVVFLIAHEIGHLRAGHFEKREIPFASKVYRTIFDPDSDQYSFSGANAIYDKLKEYTNTSLDAHCRELDADAFALSSAVDVAVDIAESRYLGYAASQVVLSILSITDRISFYNKHGEDVTNLLDGGDYFTDIALVDVMFPMEKHPWGVTRLVLLSYMMQLLMSYDKSPSADAHQFVSNLGTNISYPFSLISKEVMAISAYIASKPGEFVAMLTRQGLLTRYIKRAGESENGPVIFGWFKKRDPERGLERSDPYELYGMRKLVNDPELKRQWDMLRPYFIQE